MAAENEVKTELSQFWRENNKSRRDTALALFLKICENILQHPLEEKYKKIKLTFFYSKMDGVAHAYELMVELGFQPTDDFLIFLGEPSDLIEFVAAVDSLRVSDERILEAKRQEIIAENAARMHEIESERIAKRLQLTAKLDMSKKEKQADDRLHPTVASKGSQIKFGMKGEMVIKSKGG